MDFAVKSASPQNYQVHGIFQTCRGRRAAMQTHPLTSLQPHCDGADRGRRHASRYRKVSAGTGNPSRSKLTTVLAALILTVSGPAQAATINARSPSFVDVSTAVAAAAKGDTVIVPAGSASWTKTLVISKPITLMGQTTVNYTNETANNQTIILDDVMPRNPVIHVDVTAGDMTVEPTVPLLQIKGF